MMGRKIALWLAVPVVVVILLSLFFYRDSLNSIYYSNWVSHTIDVMTSIGDIRSDIKDAQALKQEFLETGDIDYIKPYNGKMNQVFQDFDNARQLTKDNAGQQEKLGTLKVLITRIMERSQKEIDVRHLQGFKAAQAVALADDDTGVMDDFQKIIIQMREAETSLLKERNIAEQVEFRKLNQVSLLAVLLVLVFFIVISFLIFQAAKNEALIKHANDKIRSSLEELKESQFFLETIFENVPYMIFVKDAKDLKFVRINRAGEELLGIKQEEMVGKNDYDFFPREEADFFVLKDREVLTSDHVLDIPQEIIDTKNKGRRFLHTKKIRVVGADGYTPLYLLGLSEDITDKLIVEGKLRGALVDLERSNKELEQFAYAASHDLQEPLRVIVSFTQLLERKYKDKLDDQAHTYINFAVDGAMRMQKLVDDLLSFSRIGQKGVANTDVDLNKVCERVLEDMTMTITEAQAVVEWDHLPVLYANEVQMSQLFLNLISNGVKYRSKVPVVIKITSRKIAEHQWQFSVSDNGIGIDEQYFGKLFVIFQRLHSSKEYKGTGIGLAMCKKIVENYNGRIWVESKTGEGTTFHFILKEGEKHEAC